METGLCCCFYYVLNIFYRLIFAYRPTTSGPEHFAPKTISDRALAARSVSFYSQKKRAPLDGSHCHVLILRLSRSLSRRTLLTIIIYGFSLLALLILQSLFHIMTVITELRKKDRKKEKNEKKIEICSCESNSRCCFVHRSVPPRLLQVPVCIAIALKRALRYLRPG